MAKNAVTGGHDDCLTLADGRRFGWRAYGAPWGVPQSEQVRSEKMKSGKGAAGPVILALHGTPGARLKFASLDKVARKAGVSVIAPDRWGYGLTEAPAVPSLQQFAQDIEALTAALGIDSFGVIGVSGGGPYAAAVAALMGRRVTALALVAPVGPIVGPIAGDMTAFHKFCFLHLPHIPGLVRAVFWLFRTSLRLAPDTAMHVAMARAASADKILMQLDTVRLRLIKTFIEGLRPGLHGPRIDLDLFGAPWNLPLGDISAASMLWLGDQDQNVPINAALGLAADVPGCQTTMLPGEGHLWVATHYDDVLHWMLDAM